LVVKELKSVEVSAPGKLFLIGEYAVLEGELGVALAINKRVFVRQGVKRGKVNAIRKFAFDSVGFRPQARSSFFADSSALFVGKRKLGLGSSSAMTVSAVASALVEAGMDISCKETRVLIWDIAKKFHDTAQKERGSGLDVAVSCFGGTIKMCGGQIETLSPVSLTRDLDMLHIWTGKESKTRDAIRAFREFQIKKKTVACKIVKALGDVSRGFVEACENDAKQSLAMLKEYARLLDTLGKEMGFEVVTKTMKEVQQKIQGFDAVLKPSGAGGGDIATIFFKKGLPHEYLLQNLPGNYVPLLSLEIEQDGVRCETLPL
jgi:phosphomevalonate kinase